MGLLHPELHPDRRGGMHLRTAWLLANAYGEIAHVDADTAFRLLIVDHRAALSLAQAHSEEPTHDTA